MNDLDQASGSVPWTLQLPRDSIVKLGGATSANQPVCQAANLAGNHTTQRIIIGHKKLRKLEPLGLLAYTLSTANSC
jgi:hypothetical protein